ncbi:NACHT domain protein [Actinomadura rubteroloni]|uniref:NACHT domain protein n=1 Tax=Actinomadura rubteroloni TaxID=1926885 RepID=A0A2P4UEB8_9ACTN|nr:NACHT domain-containing protein [Actinomadura rubteroloni]POM23407.1 NACHT domain protein [Actinomadura rubteroloni]
MSVEVAAINVGRSVVQIAAGRWLAGRAARAAAGKDLVDLIRTGFPDEIRRRRATRQFEGVADAVTGRIMTFAAHEFRGLTDGDRAAALFQVTLTLDRADLSDEAFLADDADPVRLARRLRAALPPRSAAAQLGEAGARLYEVTLDECCDCLARILIHLPEFTPRAAAETLSRLSGLADRVDAMLLRLPARSLDAPEGTDDDVAFTTRYLASISESLDVLDLLGVRFERFTRPRTTLSVAYISLNVARNLDRRREAPRISDWRSGERPGGSVRVEEALSGDRLTLVRGEAGGGKTTLLHWIAVTAARGHFTGELAEWNGHVPFLVKLRRHAGGPLPRPEEFLDDVAGTLSGLMPRGWAHRVLASGRSLLLVDGVDEITGPQRQDVRQWLCQMINDFPGIRVVVTSRPAAAGPDWLRHEGFSTLFLEKLGPADIRALVAHWHDAVRDASGLPCEPEKLPTYQARLMGRLESTPHLLALASSPLLASMLCALNLDREILPSNRMSLYAAVLDLLLESRDVKRDVPSARTVLVERDHKIRLLQELAWRLSTTNRVELPTSAVRALIADRLTAMPQVNAPADAVFDLLLHRSGVIREPVDGRVDFVHRTVQEYLTAKHAADLGDMDHLIHNAHRDQWRQTVVMAAGHANEPLRRELLTGILDRIPSESRRARALRLTAVSCLETLPAIPADAHDRLNECLTKLLPPRSVDQAGALAVAGKTVLMALPPTLRGYSVETAAAIVHLVTLINGPEALDLLARYASDERWEVQTRIDTAWNHFDPEEFARTVIPHAAHGFELMVDSLAKMRALRALPVGPRIRLGGGCVANLDGLGAHRASVARVSIDVALLAADDAKAFDLSFLDSLPRLDSVSLTGPLDIDDYGPLQRQDRLINLSIFDSPLPIDVDQLPRLSRARDVYLPCMNLNGGLASLIARAPSVEHLVIRDNAWLSDLGPLAATELKTLIIDDCVNVTDLGPLREQRRLKYLDVSRTSIPDVDALRHLPALETLRLDFCDEISSVEPLFDLPALKFVSVRGIRRPLDLSGFAAARWVVVQIVPGQEIIGGESLGRRLSVFP